MDSRKGNELDSLALEDEAADYYERDEESRWQMSEDVYDREQDRQDLLCVMCQSHSKDKTENPESLLCEECRSRYTKLSVPVWVIGFLVAIFAVLILSSLRLPPVISTYKTYITAEEQMEDKEYSFAMLNYLAVLEKYADSIPVIMRAADSAMQAQLFDGAAYILDTYLVGKELDDSEYQKAMQISGLIDSHYNTIERCQSLFEEVNDADELTPKLLALLDEAGTNKTYVYFLLGNISPDIGQGLRYLQLACEEDANLTYPFAYYGNALRRTGDLPAAMDAYQTALDKNACDASAIRGIGIVEQLQGNMEQGMQSIQKAYDMEPDGLYMSDAMVVALNESGRRNEALALFEGKKAEGYEFDEDMDEYLDGQITMAQYYM